MSFSIYMPVKPSANFLLAVVLTIAGFALVFAVCIYSGFYDVAAANPHAAPIHASLEELMAKSVKSHAKAVTIPAKMDLTDHGLLVRGAEHYQEMCVVCHGAPGRKLARWSQGLYPPAPLLAEAHGERNWEDRELFWMIKNGIKDTGMAAFGRSHEEDDLWALTALVRQLPSLTAGQFQALTGQAQSKGHHDEADASASPTQSDTHHH